MYLAATSDFMVSPSEIVDTVWHQHLIFTQSYQEFCQILGKQIQHIPSTHDKQEFQRFKLAKERTAKLYESTFGHQPANIWEYGYMYDSLHLPKAKLKLRTAIIIGIGACIVLTIPFYFLLRPTYVKTGSPQFMLWFIIFGILTFIALELYNRYRLQKIISQFDKDSFIFRLHPYELVYLQTKRLSDSINGTLNELVTDNIIHIKPNHTVELSQSGKTNSIEQLQITAILSDSGKKRYVSLVRELLSKPVFSNIANCMDAFIKYFNKSKAFVHLFYINFGALAFVFLLAFTRLATGITRNKPVTYIIIIIVALLVVSVIFLYRLSQLIATNIIPYQYRKEIITKQQRDENLQWRYFLLGTLALAAPLIPIVRYTTQRNNDSGGGSSCSSCGSSCSSCGGCGGD